MLAKCLGATVCAHPEGRAEIGYYPLLPTAAGRCPVSVAGLAPGLYQLQATLGNGQSARAALTVR